MRYPPFFLALALVLVACRGQGIDTDPPGQSLTDIAVVDAEIPAQDAIQKPPPPSLFEAPMPLATPELPEGLAHLGAEGCAGCHWPVVESWRTSAHSGMPSDAMKKALHAAGDAPECSRCHFPFQVQHRELVAPSQEEGQLLESMRTPNENWSPSLQSEGVGCVACHVREGTILGSRDLDAPHPVRESPEIGSSEGCAGCHQLTWEGADQPLYDTFGEWSRTTYADAGLTCMDCHMAPVAGASTPGGRTTHADHRFDARRGEGLSLHLSLSPKGATRGQALIGSVRIQNTGAGHAIPTGSPFKSLVVKIELIDVRGTAAGEGAEFIFAREVSEKSPYTTLSDTRLMAGDERTLPFEFKIPYRAKAGQGTIRASASIRHADGELSPSWTLQEIPYPVQ